MTITSKPKVIDYENSQYRTDFWIGQGREYEDLVERIALRRLLPKSGNVLIEVGAGFGRLAPLYDAYTTVVLVDYSMSLLQQAYAARGHDPRFMFVAANIYDLPFTPNVADVIVMIRVMHHLQQPALALTEIARVLNAGKHFVFEFANKRNLKSVLRFVARRQSWSPFDHEPYEFVPLNYDFHPHWMDEQMNAASFVVEKEFAVSHFRLEQLKRRVSPQLLARLDALLFAPGALLRLSPSIMARASVQKQVSPAIRRASTSGATKKGTSAKTEELSLLRCLACDHPGLLARQDALLCPRCQKSWPIVNGIYDLRDAAV
ncbi:MAG: class I SAM-dependent methyltransferase [Chloroflexi bacterium]|nr:class I SAM-dependent methyltransferase [Chloroflexota bacterium]